MKNSLSAILSSYEGKEDELIPILQQAQEKLGYLPEEAMLEVARFTGVSESKIYGVASFYSQFRFTPIGKNRVTVCRGTACHVRGAPRVLEEVERRLGVRQGETTKDLEYTIDTVACIGCCALSPCMTINKEVHIKLTPPKIDKIFSK
ncbi:MAG: NADH-quinone oxidoreductase subunit NuoE [Candidatus Omnitrophica bacterium]|nr:NADH-quinone oxidoreductase subunit NuoE [Candidatus Omnitrophota bacterium]